MVSTSKLSWPPNIDCSGRSWNIALRTWGRDGAVVAEMNLGCTWCGTASLRVCQECGVGARCVNTWCGTKEVPHVIGCAAGDKRKRDQERAAAPGSPSKKRARRAPIVSAEQRRRNLARQKVADVGMLKRERDTYVETRRGEMPDPSEFDDLGRFLQRAPTREILDVCVRDYLLEEWLQVVQRTIPDPLAACVVFGDGTAATFVMYAETGVLLDRSNNAVERCFVDGGVNVAVALLGIRHPNADNHTNALVFRRNAHGLDTVERIEPHGAKGGEALDEAIGAYFSNKTNERSVSVDPRWRYVPLAKTHAPLGPQAVENQSTSPLSVLVERGASVLVDPGAIEGFCSLWSVLMLHYIMANPRSPTKQVLLRAFGEKTPDELLRMIASYAQEVERVLRMDRASALDLAMQTGPGDFVYILNPNPLTRRRYGTRYGRVIRVDRANGNALIQGILDSGKASFMRYDPRHIRQVLDSADAAEAERLFRFLPRDRASTERVEAKKPASNGSGSSSSESGGSESASETEYPES